MSFGFNPATAAKPAPQFEDGPQIAKSKEDRIEILLWRNTKIGLIFIIAIIVGLFALSLFLA